MLIQLVITAGTLFAFWIYWTYTYWKRKGYPYWEPKTPLGVLYSVFLRERSLGMAIYDVYKASNEKVLGIYVGLRPALLIRDAQLSRDMLSKDFASFHDRGVYVDEENDPMSGGLFFLKGKKWKALRTKLTPAFTSGKLKAMFGTIEDISHKMLDHLNEIIPDEGSVEIEIKRVISCYAIDIIASVIFGLETNSFKDTSDEFYLVSQRLNEPTFGSVLRGTCQFVYPNLEKMFVRLGWTEEAPEIMRKITESTIEFREKHNIARKDMLQLLIQLRNSGKVSIDDDAWSTKSTTDSIESMSMESIAAQLFLFYGAGYETSSSAVSFTIFELAQYPEILAKAQADVEQALQRHGKLTYDAVQDMKFLELCIMETTRKYPGLPILNRECTEDYVIPDIDKVIKKGTPVVISLFGIHRDAEYFPDPMRYDPERFLEENMRYNPAAYMPFGDGPRHCIAQRMGKVNAKVALAQILSNFNIEVDPIRREIEIDNYSIPIVPKGGINVRLSKKKSLTV